MDPDKENRRMWVQISLYAYAYTVCTCLLAVLSCVEELVNIVPSKTKEGTGWSKISKGSELSLCVCSFAVVDCESLKECVHTETA